MQRYFYFGKIRKYQLVNCMRKTAYWCASTLTAESYRAAFFLEQLAGHNHYAQRSTKRGAGGARWGLLLDRTSPEQPQLLRTSPLSCCTRCSHSVGLFFSLPSAAPALMPSWHLNHVRPWTDRPDLTPAASWSCVRRTPSKPRYLVGEVTLLGAPVCTVPATHLLICSGLSSKLRTPVEILPKTVSIHTQLQIFN